jgi:polysaccharide biosynthesis protein PslA
MRPGLYGRPFEMLKFRTMYADAGDATGVKQTTANDSRVTPLGKFLRNKSIDELPQLINVLKGDMSLIGPRPHVANMLAGDVLYEELVPYYHHRYEMKPGLSGWAQANGLRGPTVDAALAKARIDHDLAYIQNFSLWLDIRIIVMTIRSEFFTGSGL